MNNKHIKNRSQKCIKRKVNALVLIQFSIMKSRCTSLIQPFTKIEVKAIILRLAEQM